MNNKQINLEIYNLLLSIKECPNKYLHDKSLDNLLSFINGYLYNKGMNGYFIKEEKLFQDFIEKYYHIKSKEKYTWESILNMFAVPSGFSLKKYKCFDDFYNILELYLKNKENK